MQIESGRSLVEMLGVLSIMGLLAFGVIKVYNGIVTRVKVQNTAKMIQTLTFERQNSAINSATGGAMNVKGPHSALHVVNGTTGNHEPYFWVETTLKDSDFCEALKESNLIQAEFIEVDNVRDGVCGENSKIAFYFKKDKGGSAYCPSHSTNCDQYGDATSCEDGYYLDGGVCSACGEHVATCEDENNPISCQEGYEIHWGQCITPPQMCRVDSDCDLCASCDTETGYCQGECEVPTPDSNDSCGENECVIYDNETQTCKYACTRVEFLESTGTQYIDTGIQNDTNVKMNFKVKPSSKSGSYFMGVDAGLVFGTNNGVNFRANGVSSINAFDTNTFYTIEMYYNGNQRFCVIDGSETLSSTVVTMLDKNILLFAAYDNLVSSPVYYLPWSISECKMWNNGTLVRDLIPVSSPKGNCMFDKVTQKLFCNQGTGEFLTD